MTKKRVGIVGLGAIAQTYVQVLAASKNATLAAAADVRPEAVEAAKAKTGCRAFVSHTEMADGCDLDAVIVCTPPASHPAVVETFLSRGIPVLCEKPLAIDTASARDILTASEKHRTLVTMASKFRFVDDVYNAKSMIEAGALGDIILIENAFNSPVNMIGRWNSRPAISGGGVLIDNGTHSVDIIRYLLGPITNVLAVAHTFTPGLEVEDNVELFATTAAGANARVDLSWTFDKQLGNYISIYGTAATLHLGWKEARINRKSAAGWETIGTGYDKVAAFGGNLANFLAACDGRAPALVTPADAMASVKTISAAYHAASQNRWVSADAGTDPVMQVVAQGAAARQ